MPSRVQEIIQRWNPEIEKYIKAMCDWVSVCEHFKETKGKVQIYVTSTHKYTGYCMGREIHFSKRDTIENVLEVLLEELTWLIEKVAHIPYLTLNLDDLMSVSDEPYDWAFGEMNRYYLWKERTTNTCVRLSG